MYTAGVLRNVRASNAFVYHKYKLSLSRGHFETFRGDPKTLRASLIVSCFPTELEKNSITGCYREEPETILAKIIGRTEENL